MSTMADKFEELGVIPVVVLNDVKDALPLAKALYEGGLPCAEVTFRTAAAEESIRVMHEAYPDMVLAAGTVLTTEQVDRAVAAGASLIVSPGFDPEIVDYCISKNIEVVPGIVTPSELAQAVKRGLTRVKFFPAEASGGLEMIKAMSAPYGNMKFMPTGGIHAKNLISYLDFKKIIACGGSWMVKPELVEAGEFDKIATLTREAVQGMLGFELKHIGINQNSEEEADQAADTFENLFGFAKKTGASSIFAGAGIELMKAPYLGNHGHIAIGTNYIERAIYHMEKQGARFQKDTAKYNAKGDLVAIYLDGEVGGFAVHLLQK